MSVASDLGTGQSIILYRTIETAISLNLARQPRIRVGGAFHHLITSGDHPKAIARVRQPSNAWLWPAEVQVGKQRGQEDI